MSQETTKAPTSVEASAAHPQNSSAPTPITTGWAPVDAICARLGDYVAHTSEQLPSHLRWTHKHHPELVLPAQVYQWDDGSGTPKPQVRPATALPPKKEGAKARKYVCGQADRGRYASIGLIQESSVPGAGPVVFQEGTKQSRWLAAALNEAGLEYAVLALPGKDALVNGRTDLSFLAGRDVFLAFDGDRLKPEIAESERITVERFHRASAASVHILVLRPELMSAPNDGWDDVFARELDDPLSDGPGALIAREMQHSVVAPPNPTLPLPEDGDSDSPALGDGKINVSSPAVVTGWLREELGRGELAGIFCREDVLVHTPRIGSAGYVAPTREGYEDGPAQVRVMDAAQLNARIQMRYNVGKNKEEETEDAEGNKVKRKHWISAMFPSAATTTIHNAVRAGEDIPNLRVLRTVTHTPMVRQDGTVLDQPGYDPATRALYLPDGDVDTSTVPAEPSRAQVNEAMELILRPVEEFPFVHEDHRANWVGALFTPILRALLPPPYPMLVISAADAGTGKSYLAAILRTVHGGVLKAELQRDGNEMSKELIATLASTTGAVVQFDNVKGEVRSSQLEALLTGRTITGRWLGESRDITVANDRLWCLTANNAKFSGDLARRLLWVNLDARMPNPETRTGFRLKPVQWAQEHRGEILAALLTVARGWVLAGSPLADQVRSDDYGDWTAAIGGMLDWAGVPGQFGGTGGLGKVATEDDSEWGRFLTSVRDSFGDQGWTVAMLTERIGAPGKFSPSTAMIDPEALPGDVVDKFDRMVAGNGRTGFNRVLGAWISNRVGRYAAGLVVEEVKKSTRGTTYRISAYGS